MTEDRKVEIRLPKGTRDYAGSDYAKMRRLQDIIRDIFRIHRAEYLETPTFELTDVLTNKYGEDEKLIYNLECSVKSKSDEKGESDDKGDVTSNGKSEVEEITSDLTESMFKESLSLRYDLTVPLVRYCIQNKINKMRRASIGKVYRRETTSASNKRLREFYQADFDFVGEFEELLPELSIFVMIQDLFGRLNIENYEIIYNYRQILDLCTQKAQIDKNLFGAVCSSIDKLDKADRDYVMIELESKGLTKSQIDTLFGAIDDNAVISDVTKDFDMRFNEAMRSMCNIDISKIRMDRTLARGSDYYTGIIFEVKLTDSEFTSSVAGGGRYDKLIPSYLPAPKPSRKQRKAGITKLDPSFPMIGFSFGLDRLLHFVPDTSIKDARPVWVGTIGKVDQNIKLDIVSRFQKAGICVLYNLKSRKFTKEIQESEGANCSHTLIVGEAEYAESKFKLKDMDERTETMHSFHELDNIIERISSK